MLSRPRTMPAAKLVTPSISLLFYPYYSPLENHCQEGWQASKPKDYALCPVQKKVTEVLPSRFHLVITWQHLRTHPSSARFVLQSVVKLWPCCKVLQSVVKPWPLPLLILTKWLRPNLRQRGNLWNEQTLCNLTLLSSATGHQERVEEQIWGGCSTLEKRCWKLITNSGGAPASA